MNFKRRCAFMLMITSLFMWNCNRDAQPDENSDSHLFKDLSPTDAWQFIQQHANDANFKLIDVRTPGEYASGHITGATNLDYYAPGFRDSLNALDKTKTIMIYCRSGNRSGRTVNMMETMEFTKVYHIENGLIGWQRDNLPLEQ